MAQLSSYETVVNGITTTLRLSAADAKKRGLTKTSADAKKAADDAAAAKAAAEEAAKKAADEAAAKEAAAKKAPGK